MGNVAMVLIFVFELSNNDKDDCITIRINTKGFIRYIGVENDVGKNLRTVRTSTFIGNYYRRKVCLKETFEEFI